MTWLDESVQEHRRLLFHIVLKAGLSAKDAEDLVQVLYANLITKQPPRPTNPRAFLATCLRRLVIDLVRKRAGTLEKGRRSLDGLSEPIDAREPSPMENVRRHEQAARRRLLVCDLFSGYVEYADEGERWEQREVMERSLRGQLPQEIAIGMNIKPARVHTHRFEATKWLAQRVAERDGNGSILMSAFTTPPPSVELPESSRVDERRAGRESDDSRRTQGNPDAPLPTVMREIVEWAIDDVGALCPGATRLQVARERKFGDWPSDLRYHIVESGCEICAERLAVDGI